MRLMIGKYEKLSTFSEKGWKWYRKMSKEKRGSGAYGNEIDMRP